MTSLPARLDGMWCPNSPGAFAGVEGTSVRIVFLEFGKHVQSSCAESHVMWPKKKKRKMWPLEDTPCEFGHNPYPCTNAARHAGNVFLSIVNVVDTQVALLLPTGNMECRHTEIFM